jgi:hypothetical protein
MTKYVTRFMGKMVKINYLHRMGEKSNRTWKIMFLFINRLENLVQRNLANMTFRGQKLSLLGKFMNRVMWVIFFSCSFNGIISYKNFWNHCYWTLQSKNNSTRKKLYKWDINGGVKKGKSWNKLAPYFFRKHMHSLQHSRNFYFKNMFCIKNVIFCGIQFFSELVC